MDPSNFIDPNLTGPDLLVLKNLLDDADGASPQLGEKDSVSSNGARLRKSTQIGSAADGIPSDEDTIQKLKAFNKAGTAEFEPTVFVTWDMKDLAKLPSILQSLLHSYIKVARNIVRVETDVVMLTHLILYFSTSVPSAILLFQPGHFNWFHGIAHWVMQTYFVGTYTLMMHQHIHMGGILAKKPWIAWFDAIFPYITNPLMGHTWNSYYYHHVKHHHVEGNGPDDLSSTIRYQRDEIFDFMCYVGRFFFFIWFELPLYFWRKGKTSMALKAAFWEVGNYLVLALLWKYVNWRATLCVFLLPLLQLRVGLMVGNWGQHAFVDEVDPNSDFRSSITLIDVPSNRFCYNDGYHTSHHLNPLRHWRDHPVSLLQQKERYAAEHALVFRNIDYIMITIKLMRKDYGFLAKCLVPMGDQVGMSMDERADMLKTKTRKFSEKDVSAKF